MTIRLDGAATRAIKRAHENKLRVRYEEPVDGIMKFVLDSNYAAAKVGPRATNHSEFMRLLRLELVEMGYSEFA